MKPQRAALLLLLAALTLLFTSIAHTFHTFATCDGTTVRGLLWMKCIEEQTQ